MSSSPTRRQLPQAQTTTTIIESILVLWCCTVLSSAEIEGRPRLDEYLPENNQPLPLNTSTTTCHSDLMVTALQPPPASQRILRSLSDMLSNATATDENEISSFLSVDTETLAEESMQFQLTTDGSGDTTETTSESSTSTTMGTSIPISQTTPMTSITSRLSTPSTTENPIIDLDGLSQFVLELFCGNASSVFDNIIQKFNQTFTFPSQIAFDNKTLFCSRSTVTDVKLNITTDRNITAITELYRVLKMITSEVGVKLSVVNRCTDGETIEVPDVDVCYVIDLCRLCGRSPPRGVCLAQQNVSRCQCFANTNDPSMVYAGEFCLPEKAPITSPTSSLSGTTAVVVGVVAGIAGLFVVITAYLLIMGYCRHRRRRQNSVQQALTTQLPRITMPTFSFDANDNNRLGTSRSTVSSTLVESDPVLDGTLDRTFLDELDYLIEARSSAPQQNEVIVMDEFLKGAITSSEHRDRINELDSIIDNEDVPNFFHDSTDTRSHDPSIFEAINPNFRLSRKNENADPIDPTSSFV